MDTPEQYELGEISIARSTVKVDSIPVAVERHRLPTGELFMYKLHIQTGTVVGELIEGYWNHYYTTQLDHRIIKGRIANVIQTTSHTSEALPKVEHIIRLITSPDDISECTLTEVSTSSRNIGDGMVEQHIDVELKIDGICNRYSFEVRENSFICKQDGEIIALENTNYSSTFVSDAPYTPNIPSIARYDQIFEVMTDDYMLILVPYSGVYLGKIVRPKPYQTEG